ncbi:hypothetical protein AAFF_G00401970 [Aldrovandia affinis]|uniref:Uncharacterized protein n=1 Tax=Aldrovandia affinis TaxID=143900 RepID=A0AAD7T781_9TELE|nr:hypothetical protein AAFF_G00401970 [Aldrovandia affinis]
MVTGEERRSEESLRRRSESGSPGPDMACERSPQRTTGGCAAPTGCSLQFMIQLCMKRASTINSRWRGQVAEGPPGISRGGDQAGGVCLNALPSASAWVAGDVRQQASSQRAKMLQR